MLSHRPPNTSQLFDRTSGVPDFGICLKNPSPSIYVDELAADGVLIKARMWAPSEVWWDIRTTMLWKIKCALEADGMEIPFPQRTIWINPEEGDESKSRIPPDSCSITETPKSICSMPSTLHKQRQPRPYSTTPYNGPDQPEK